MCCCNYLNWMMMSYDYLTSSWWGILPSRSNRLSHRVDSDGKGKSLVPWHYPFVYFGCCFPFLWLLFCSEWRVAHPWVNWVNNVQKHGISNSVWLYQTRHFLLTRNDMIGLGYISSKHLNLFSLILRGIKSNFLQ